MKRKRENKIRGTSKESREGKEIRTCRCVCWKKKKILFHLAHKIQEYDPLFILK